ncbi:ArsR family transcriptional regulator [Actinoplanes sp. SE50]|uniref:helix-turn-helix domain-containing protein n=1 Tax=unclassified Actinoplanes TaxID=2626549 RepID=UPI00023ED6BC|nr:MULTISPECIES: helix-turn-helix domain-containing protein [unclassified Actinoplanes]AEV87380.1 Dihydroorotate dehydrogenase [Actinoplanes sp. SE50/110]ATO85782.1 ArsR family transcriptional regulator [Actinoplanes sp. SE50]SLM03195.1 ArsR-family transcriptional regulator [Actinoplanes sp. SE50/110]
MADKLIEVRLTGPQIRALAQPLRLRLLGRLRQAGPATATRLAADLDTNTGATSYHLRQLAEVGLVIEEARPGSGRQRWWRAAHDTSHFRRSYYEDDPEATAAAEWLETYQVSHFAQAAENWRRALPGEPESWQNAAGISDYTVHLDAARTEAMMREIEAVIERYRQAGQDDPRPGTRPVMVVAAALPRVAS